MEINRRQRQVLASCVPDAEGLIAATPFAGKFWWVRGSMARLYPDAGPGIADDVQSTEDLFAAIARDIAIVPSGSEDAVGHFLTSCCSCRSGKGC